MIGSFGLQPGWRAAFRGRRPAPAGAWLCGAVVLAMLGVTGCATSRREPDFDLISQAWNTIQHQYVDRAALQPTDLTYGAIGGMVDALGDTGHSTFLTPDAVKELRDMEKGEFKGIGVEIQVKGGRIVVVAPIDDSPAQRAGIQPGDIILKVGNEDISDWPLNRVVEKIGGRAGTRVTLTLQDPRTVHTRQVTVTRAAVKLHDVTWCRLPGTSLAYVRLATFDAGVNRDLTKALQAIQRAGLSGIVLDLRNNPGGLLDEAVSVTSQFLSSGNVLVAKTASGETTPVPVEQGGLATNSPLVVLINEGSASAAEIVAGALQDAKRAPLIGDTSFGTGTVLEEFRLSDGSALLLAVEEWLTPAGHSFWHKGITPQISVPLGTDVNPLLPVVARNLTPAELQASPDLQLLRAVDLLNHDPKVRKSNAASEASSGNTRPAEAVKTGVPRL